MAPHDPGRDRVYPRRLQRPAVHPLFLRHHRCAEMHRPRRRAGDRDPRQGTSAARRREAGRPGLLVHDLRLDDVELGRLARWPRRRQSCSTTVRPSIRMAMRCSTIADDAKITLFGTSAKFIDACSKAGLEAHRNTRSFQRRVDCIDRFRAGAGGLRLHLRECQSRCASLLDVRRGPICSAASSARTRLRRSIAANSRRRASP